MRNFLATLLIVIFSIQLYAQNNYLPNIIVIKYKSLASQKNSSDLPPFVFNVINKSEIRRHIPMFLGHLQKSSAIKLSNIYIIELVNNSGLLNKIHALNNFADVEYAQPYYLPELLNEQNDPSIGGQYYLNIIKAFEAHEVTRGDTNIIIGIVDTGIDMLHPDLIDNVKYNYADPINGIDDDLDGFVDNYRGWDVADNDNNPARFYSSHGTMVAGLASATCNNNIGIYSIGYNTKVMPIKIMDSRGYLSAGYQGIVYAADHGCQIINCSWGSQIKSPLCDDVINYAVNEKNCLVVAAAGNARTDIPYYPAACEGVLNVANTNRYDNKSSKSTFGVEVDICAPGEQVLTTYGASGYLQGWGTSFAAPIVAGSAALVKAKFPEYTGLQIGEQLRITADIIDTMSNNLYFQRHMGRGRLNAYRALTIDTLPSLRITDHNLRGSHSTFLPGDTLNVTFSVTNYLSQITNTVVQLTTDADFTTSINNTFQTGHLATLESVNNNSQAMQFVIKENAPYDHNLELDFKFDGYGYDDYQIFKTLINPSFIDVEMHNISTSLTSNGRIGFANSQTKLGKGLYYKEYSNFLPEGGIIIGNARDNIASSIYDIFDFDIVDVIDTSSFSNQYLKGVTSYRVGDKYNSLPIFIKQESRIYKDELLADVIVHNYTIVNEDANDIQDFSFSVFTDFDIDNSYTNKLEYIDDYQLFFTKTTTSTNSYAGVALISQDSCIPYAFDLTTGGNGGLDITSGFSDDQKWFAMSNPRINDGNLNDTIDIASMLSTVKQNLMGNDSLQFTFCFVIADSYYSLIEKTRLIKELLFPDPIINSSISNNSEFNIYPNPCKDKLFISFKSSKQNKLIQIYNHTGKLVSKFESTKELIELSTVNYKAGLYFIKIDNGSSTYSEKLIIY